ncbi:MAG: energy transducer TonB [Bacteroidaceae bacterium]|jgi:protein TonB|nr:energy transducer TonB [Bacteroidaceae bacterium]MBO7267934.1 energy transducer TonB [Bacteroidaceae bacterium]
MEIKKSESANLENKKFTWILLGFVLVLAAHFVAFEWTQYEQEFSGDIIDSGDIILEEEIVPITMPEKKTVPPPPQAVSQAEVLNIVEDDAEIEETTIVSNEDQAEFVEITDDVPIVVEEPEEEDQIFQVVEEDATFPGGTAELMKYLQKNIKYPSICQEQGIQGRVIVQFVVEKDGSITDVQVIKAINPYLDKEAVRVVSTMPKWSPGKQRGKPVRVRFTLPVTFRLSN